MYKIEDLISCKEAYNFASHPGFFLYAGVYCSEGIVLMNSKGTMHYVKEKVQRRVQIIGRQLYGMVIKFCNFLSFQISDLSSDAILLQDNNNNTAKSTSCSPG